MIEKLLNLVNEKDLPEPYDHICRLIGLEGTKELARELGGEMLYLPKIDTILKLTRTRLIQNEFDGYNYVALAKKYGLTSKWIRQIVGGN